jgi:hypothetical protein
LKLNKSKCISTIAFVLLLLISTFVTVIPDAKAADVTTIAYLSVAPNPVGVDQTLTLVANVQPIPPTGFDVYHGLTITITKPDGTTQTIGPLDTSTIGSQFATYTPTMVGTYEFKMEYAGETFPSGATHLPSRKNRYSLGQKIRLPLVTGNDLSTPETGTGETLQAIGL